MLRYLFNPSSIAVIGASTDPKKVGNAVLINLINGGFKGHIIRGNPKADKILDVRCYKDLSEYEGAVDMSVIAIPTQSVKDAVTSSISAGAKAIIVITAGFQEDDEEGGGPEEN